MTVRKPTTAGFTLVEIMIVVALIGLLATIATPTWVRARTNSQTNACVNNLRQIEGAKQQWGLETKQSPSSVPTYTELSSYLKHAVSCPSSSDTTFAASYEMNPLSSPVACKVVPAHIMPPEPSN
jgi:prepilin-type N-terminal cleavage/methylation domain-containing protein